jgi:hypothetical protein
MVDFKHERRTTRHTASAMLRYPDFFKVGIAASGNHDQRLFWSTWGERGQGFAAFGHVTSGMA